MEQIFEPNAQFQFDKLVLTNPIFVNSGNYFIKYIMNDSPLYIQPPKCATKQGFVKGGKKIFCDLLFTNENESFIRWIEDLENYSQKYIFNNREKWFETDLEMHDIESSFTSPLKLYKSGKFYIVRTIIPTRLGKCTLRIFDEQEMDVPMESIQDGTVVMTIWEIQGIKCSTRNFQIDIEVKQMMVIPKSNLFDRCVISKNSEFSKGDSDTLLGSQPLNTEGALRASVPCSLGITNSEGGHQERVPPETLPKVSSEETTNIVSPLPEPPQKMVEETNQEQNTSYTNVSAPQSTQITFGDQVGDPLRGSLTEGAQGLRPPSGVSDPMPKMVESTEKEAILVRGAESPPTSPATNLVGHLGDRISLDESDNDDEYDQDNEFTIDIDEMESDDNVPITTDYEPSSEVEIIDFNPDDIQEPNDFQLKTRNDVYYEIYTNAKKKAEEARNLAISAFLEAKRIKDLYLIHEPLDIFTGK
jgi:hypothetical protein